MEIPFEKPSMQMLNVGFVRHDGDWNWKDVCSPFTRIYYVTEGEAMVHFASRSVKLTPGHLYIIPAHSVHSYECHGLFSHYYLHMFEVHHTNANLLEFYKLPSEVVASDLDLALLQDMCARHPEAQLPASDPKSYDNTTTFSHYVEHRSNMPVSEKIMLEGSIMILLSRFLKNATARSWTKDIRIAKIMRYINKNIDNEITVEELANMACLTTPYLIRIFKRTLGISPLQYINKKKIEKAQLLLITGSMTIKEVAYSLGYNDHSYFNRIFRKTCGKTPLEYREEMKGMMGNSIN